MGRRSGSLTPMHSRSVMTRQSHSQTPMAPDWARRSATDPARTTALAGARGSGQRRAPGRGGGSPRGPAPRPRYRSADRRRSTVEATCWRGGYQYGRLGALRPRLRYDAAPMARPTDELRTRVLPAMLTAFGVTILSAGLLTYTVPVPAGPSSAPVT